MRVKEDAKKTEAALRKKYPQYDEIRKKLKQRFKKEPFPYDVSWAILNNELIIHSANGNWGLYRNTKLTMAEQLRKEHRDKEALVMLLEVCYLDVNGPQNSARIFNIPAFDPKQSFTAPGIISRIVGLAERLRLKEKQLKKIFLEHNQQVYAAMKLPLDPEKSWEKIRKELYE